ncbi:hypothetical protein EB241_06215 [Erwinia psidii]|uniref:Uncharacterized protein n=1 Tax=Erwinia psidii TaxID=69224 RepID=A0A3N6UTQ9_9GAMM|nr:hypothetical protein EB241_06215 [Erwinia psidii]
MRILSLIANASGRRRQTALWGEGKKTTDRAKHFRADIRRPKMRFAGMPSCGKELLLLMVKQNRGSTRV